MNMHAAALYCAFGPICCRIKASTCDQTFGFRAIDGVLLILKSEISDDLRPGRILGADFGSPVDHSVWLVEICSLGDVWRNHSVMLASVRDAVHLDCQKDGNPAFFKVPRKMHHG